MGLRTQTGDAVTQYDRSYRLIVHGFSDTQGLDLSECRIRFSIKRTNTMTPNVADIRIYNLDDATANGIFKRFNRPSLISPAQGEVILEAGYLGNSGVIFRGTIYQVVIGRESATDTFVDLVAGDGSLAYNYSIVNQTIDAGATQRQIISAAAKTMSKYGVTEGEIQDLPKTTLPRGKVMFGNSRDILRTAAKSTGCDWSIQNSKVTFVKNQGFLPGEAVLLTTATGLIGMPNQTNEGINVKCLLNPSISVGKRFKIDNALVQQAKINLGQLNQPAPYPLAIDGVYHAWVVEHQGDSRGIDWYTTIIGLRMDQMISMDSQVIGGQGG